VWELAFAGLANGGFCGNGSLFLCANIRASLNKSTSSSLSFQNLGVDGEHVFFVGFLNGGENSGPLASIMELGEFDEPADPVGEGDGTFFTATSSS
jgi:hypothetical protein